MAFILKDRVKETTTFTGTGAVSLGGAAATFDTFQSYMSNGDTTYYAIVHTASGTDEWEVGIGTWNTGDTLTRTTVLAGSNGASAVDFSAGTKDIFMTYPASKAVYTDADGDIDINGGTIDGTTIGATTADTGKFTTIETTGSTGYIDLAHFSTHPTHAEGRIFYDSEHGTLNVFNDEADITLEIGQEQYVRVYNNSGATIGNGKPVYFSGQTSGTPTIALANATDSSKYNVRGLATHDIENSSYGYVTHSGLVRGIDTSGLTAGSNVFLGLTDGALTNTSPSYPNYPQCIGYCVVSSASEGEIYVDEQNHTVNSFRTVNDAHVGGDLTVSGDLTVTGTQTVTSSNNVNLGASFQYLNSGDTIGASGTSQTTGSGLDDATLTGHYTGTASKTFYVKIDGTGTPDTFSWSDDNFATTEATGVSITGSDQTLADGISVKFAATTGHTLNDVWSGTAAPANVDTGLFTNRNTGSSGVGYTHMGLFFDASTEKWTLLDEYDPEPSGTINLADSSVSYATLKAGTIEADLTGDVTGAVTGNASTATALETPRNIGGVSFDGSANINLPGVNTTGNQNTTGSAATLTTARTIQLTGDVTGSATFDGSANASITAVVQDDSHNHVISNVDGLQSALDDKADDTITFTAGNGLTGGGNLTANRTLAVGAGSGITVNANDVAHSDTSTQASVNNSGNTFIQDVTLDGFGHVTGLTSSSVSIGNATITISAGGGLQTGGDFTTNQSSNETITLAHADTSTQASVNNSGRTYIQDITLDGYGHITGISSATETVTDTTYSAGSGLSLSGTTFSHTDTSSQGSVNNSGGTVIQDVTLDTYGHVTGLTSYNLDGRYYTETEADSRFVNVTGDTMTGALRHDQDSLTASGGTLTINLANANNFYVTMTSNTTFAFSNRDAGRYGNIIIKQDASGGRTFTLPSQCKTPVNGASIVQATNANEISILSYYVVDANNILVNYIGDFA